MFLLNDYLCWLFGVPTEREEFCLGNVDFFPYFEIAPWCLGVKGKVLNYSPHEIHEYSAFFPPVPKGRYFQVPPCWKLHSRTFHISYRETALVLWFDNGIVKATGRRREANSGPEWCLKKYQELPNCKRKKGKYSHRGNPQSSWGIHLLLSICSLPEFISQIVWASTGLRNNDA